MIKRYRKNPVAIEAVQFTEDNALECVNFCNGIFFDRKPEPSFIMIATLEGDMKASLGDYIIKGVNNEFYPCKPDIFAVTYEEVV